MPWVRFPQNANIFSKDFFFVFFALFLNEIRTYTIETPFHLFCHKMKKKKKKKTPGFEPLTMGAQYQKPSALTAWPNRSR